MWWMAGVWGWLAGVALLLGAIVGWWVKLPVRLTASVMAFGSGVLLSALSFDLMDDAQKHGGLPATGAGFIVGAGLFTAITALLARRGAKHRKRSGGKQASESEHPGSGLAIAVGALLDGIPESIVIGTSMLVSAVTATAAGAILAMLIDTMIPEAFEESHSIAGLVAVAGFLAAFAMSKAAESTEGEQCDERGAPPAMMAQP